MALKDLLGLIDDKLKAVYDTVAYSPDRDRDRLLKRIDATKAKFNATEPARGVKDYSVANNTVRYTPTINGQPITIHGKAELYIPSERFGDFLDKLRHAVEQGELDDQLKAASEAGGSSSGTEAKPRAARKPRETSGDGSGWSPERRAKFEATLAARNAGKGSK